MTGPPAAGAPVPGGTHAALPAPRPAPRATGPHDTRQHHGPQRPARPASATITKHRPGLGWRWGAAEQDVSARVGPSPKAGRVWHQVRVSVRPSPAGTHGGGRWLQQPSAPPPAPSRQAASAPGPRPHAPRGGLCPGLRAQGARMPAAGTYSSAKPAPDGLARTRPAFFGCEVAGGSQIQPRRPQASTGFVRRRTRPPWRVGAQGAARDPQAPTRSCPRIRHASRHHSDPWDRSLLWLAASRVSDPTSLCRDPGPGPCGRVHVPTAGSLGWLPEGGLRPPVGCEAPPLVLAVTALGAAPVTLPRLSLATSSGVLRGRDSLPGGCARLAVASCRGCSAGNSLQGPRRPRCRASVPRPSHSRPPAGLCRVGVTTASLSRRLPLGCTVRGAV